MNPTRILFLSLFFAAALASSAQAGNDEESEICTEKGYEAQVQCILKKCGRFAPGSTAQLKCEEDWADLCETTGKDVEKRCLGVR